MKYFSLCLGFCALLVVHISSSAEEKFVGLPEPGILKQEKGVTELHSSVSSGSMVNPGNQRKPGVIKVGANRKFTTLSMAAEFSVDGDTIEIDANGDYEGDEVIWTKNNLHIRGVDGRPHITSRSLLRNRKALWVIRGNNTIVENIEFSGAKVADRNGAGIRLEGNNLTVRYSYFHDNENGILTGSNPDSNVMIEYSEFAYNGLGNGKTHNIYIGAINKFSLRFSNSHHARVGHNVKSRARENFISYNRIMDESGGNASYQLDFSNGGTAYLVGNVIQQGPKAQNWAIIAFGLEGFRYPKNKLILANNTIVNDRHNGRFINAKTGTELMLVNNIFAGKGKVPDYESLKVFNLVKREPEFINRKGYNYRLKPGSQAINKGKKLNEYDGVKIKPVYEYMHNSRAKLRPRVGALDFGAFEYVN